MNYLKKIVKPLLVGFLTMLISLFLFTTLEYIGWISNNTFKVMTTLISILGFLVSGIIFGKRSSDELVILIAFSICDYFLTIGHFFTYDLNVDIGGGEPIIVLFKS